MRVLVCGGRHFGNAAALQNRFTPAWSTACERDSRDIGDLLTTLDELDPRPTLIIHGAAKGADRLAASWADEEGIPQTGDTYKVNWYPKGRSGGLDRSQGPLRNQRMIDEGRPDLVIAARGGAGTADMISRARQAGIEVREIGRSVSQGER